MSSSSRWTRRGPVSSPTSRRASRRVGHPGGAVAASARAGHRGGRSHDARADQLARMGLRRSASWPAISIGAIAISLVLQFRIHPEAKPLPVRFGSSDPAGGGRAARRTSSDDRGVELCGARARRAWLAGCRGDAARPAVHRPARLRARVLARIDAAALSGVLGTDGRPRRPRRGVLDGRRSPAAPRASSIHPDQGPQTPPWRSERAAPGGRRSALQGLDEPTRATTPRSEPRSGSRSEPCVRASSPPSNAGRSSAPAPRPRPGRPSPLHRGPLTPPGGTAAPLRPPPPLTRQARDPRPRNDRSRPRPKPPAHRAARPEGPASIVRRRGAAVALVLVAANLGEAALLVEGRPQVGMIPPARHAAR